MKAHYDKYIQEALIMAQGDTQKADYILDCTWYMYLNRKDSMRKYNEAVKQQIEAAKTK